MFLIPIKLGTSTFSPYLIFCGGTSSNVLNTSAKNCSKT